MLKKYKTHIAFFYICCAVSLVAAIFFDLKIDIALNNPKDAFSLWFYATGEIPARLVLPLAGAVIFTLCKGVITRLIGLISTLGGSVYLGLHLAKYLFKDENNFIFGALFGLGIGIIIIIACPYIKIPNCAKQALLVFAWAGIAVMAGEIILTEVCKYLWARPRFRYLLTLDSFDRFTPWYKINGFNFDEGNEVKSFPSGHTAGAAVSFLIMLLPYCFDKFKSKNTLCFATAFIYTVTVAFTRLVLGAHFLSDVTFGAMLTFTLVIISMAVIDKKYKNKLLQEENK